MTSSTPREALQVFNALSDEHDVVIAPDDRHAPAFHAGDLLVIDPAMKAPQHGSFFAVEYQQRTDDDGLRSVQSVQQCRRSAIISEAYVLGASAPAYRHKAVDGFYDRRQFEQSVQGRIIGILRD